MNTRVFNMLVRILPASISVVDQSYKWKIGSLLPFGIILEGDKWKIGSLLPFGIILEGDKSMALIFVNEKIILAVHAFFENNEEIGKFEEFIFSTPARGLSMLQWGILILGLGVTLGTSQDIDCQEDPEYYQNLTGAFIGKSKHENILIFPCDTMVVPEGKAAVIKRNTYLSFLTNSPNNIILVHGSLTIEGGGQEFCTITNGLDSSNSLGYIYPTKNNWLGFYVSTTGRLFLTNTIICGTKIPIRSESDQIELKKVIFEEPEFLLYKGEFVVLFNGKKVIQYLGFSDTANSLMHQGIQMLRLGPHKRGQTIDPIGESSRKLSEIIAARK